MHDSPEIVLSQAEGYLELGLHEDAWFALEELPATVRAHPDVLEVRLRILTAMGKWLLGQELARVLALSPVEKVKFREAAARFYHVYARHLSMDGHNEESRMAIRKAVAAWSGIRLAIVEDEEIESLWSDQ